MNYFDNFVALLSKWNTAYIHAVHSYVGAKTAQGFRLLSGRVLFETALHKTDSAPFKFATGKVIAGRFVKVLAASDITAILEKAKTGEMESLDGALALAPDPSTKLSDWMAPIEHPFIVRLRISGISRHNLASTHYYQQLIDEDVKIADVPFDTVDELLIHCGLPPATQGGDSTILEIVASSPGIISKDSIIKTGHANIECRIAKALEPAKLKLGFRVFKRDQTIDRASVTGGDLKWCGKDGLNVGLHDAPVGSAALLHAYLSYDGVLLDLQPVEDPKKPLNPRYAIYRILDPGLDLLKRKLLNLDKDKYQDFEGDVSTLLMLLGFSAANTGRKRRVEDGPDIIVTTPSDSVGIIECTTGFLNNDNKLSKLIKRTQLIKSELSDSEYSALQIQPVIITQFSRNDVTADLKTAADSRIAVVCKEDLENLLSQAALPPNPDQILQNWIKSIPAPEREFGSFVHF
jgi:hypothetical protein